MGSTMRGSRAEVVSDFVRQVPPAADSERELDPSTSSASADSRGKRGRTCCCAPFASPRTPAWPIRGCDARRPVRVCAARGARRRARRHRCRRVPWVLDRSEREPRHCRLLRARLPLGGLATHSSRPRSTGCRCSRLTRSSGRPTSSRRPHRPTRTGGRAKSALPRIA